MVIGIKSEWPQNRKPKRLDESLVKAITRWKCSTSLSSTIKSYSFPLIYFLLMGKYLALCINFEIFTHFQTINISCLGSFKNSASWRWMLDTMTSEVLFLQSRVSWLHHQKVWDVVTLWCSQSQSRLALCQSQGLGAGGDRSDPSPGENSWVCLGAIAQEGSVSTGRSNA